MTTMLLEGFEDNMERFCGTPFWNATLTWSGNWPDFTECFQQTALVWVPCLWLWLVGPLYLRNLLLSPYCPIAVNNFNITKTIVSLLIAFVTFLDLLKTISDYATGKTPFVVFTVTPLVQTLTFIICSTLIQLERSRGYVTSGLLFIFFLLLVVCGVVPFYTRIVHALDEGVSDLYGFITFYAYYCLVWVQFVLVCVADSSPPIIEYSLEDHCPEISASFLSRISFHWITRLVIRGYKKTLIETDLFRLNPRDTSATNGPKVEKAWQEQMRQREGVPLDAQSLDVFPRYATNSDREPLLVNGPPAMDVAPAVSVKSSGKEPSLLKVLVKCFGWDWLKGQICKLVADVCVFVFPVLLQQLIRFTTDDTVQLWKGYLFAVAFFLVSIVQSVFFHQLFHISMTMGMRMKAALIAVIYKKSLTMCKGATKDSTVGEIVNLMSVDAQRIQEVATYLWLMWSSPLQIIVCVVFLYNVMGWAVMAGVAVLVLTIPLNAVVASKIETAQTEQMELKDSRIKTMSEILTGIKLLKFYAWELSFIDRVNVIRRNELKKLFRINVINGLIMFFWTCAPFAVTIAVFATYVMSSSDNILTAEKAFVSISLFNIMKFPMTVLPMMIVYVVTAKVSIARISKFLKHRDLDPNNVQYRPESEQAVLIAEGSFAWDREGESCLHGIDVSITRGSLSAIVGQVGAGKSSLLAAMLGEMEKVSGRVEVSGKIAYVSQQAWIQNATLRDNILFGQPFHAGRYGDVLRACALEPDLQMLPAGDMTEIGERGINLSGGQKQRVSLARAVYQNLDIYLLDDPLSAVDAHVGKHIFEQVVGAQGVLKDKTRILVTHGVHWLPHTDTIMVMVDGMITESGTYRQLLDRRQAFATFLKTYFVQHREEEAAASEDEEDPELLELKQEVLREVESSPDTTEVALKFERLNDRKHILTDRRQVSTDAKILERQVSQKDKDKEKEPEPREEDKLIEEEEVEVGTVKWPVYWSYMRALNPLLVLAYMVVLAGSYGVTIWSNIWITIWTDDPRMSNGTVETNSTEYTDLRNYYLEMYGGIGVIEGVLVMSYSIIFAVATVRASRAMHTKMLDRIMRAPLSFFDTTPIGRIINRFSRDMETVDNTLPETLQMNVMDPFMMVVSTVVVISYSTPLFLAAVAILSALYYVVQRIYIPTSRQLNRLESKTRSPVYNHFTETLTGTTTIRAFNHQQRFNNTLEQRVDQNLIFHFAMICCNRWLGLRLEVLGSLAVFGAALLAVVGRGVLTGGLVGLSITYALEITENLNWIVRGACELETNIVAVERVEEYSQGPTEAPWEVDETSPPLSWPDEGRVDFQNYSSRYREGLDLVLDGLRFHIASGEKVGIVGRTGAGKSSMTLSLFRIIEPAGGRILIDDVDISTLGLHRLRSKLTILPQDPVLFSGTLRSNLDPFEQYTDAEVWLALDHAHMQKFISEKVEGLAFECGEGGQNMSVGQRQLICLARTLLHKTRILIFDEATAAIDLETDSLIQETIRREFARCTILTIAHRLNTIMDSDRVMVLQSGRVVEFETPATLLDDKNSAFYAMAKDAGLA